MSTHYRSLTPLRMHDLFGGAFEPLGIREYADPRWTTPTSRCLTDGANWLWVYADDEGAVTHMKRCGLFNIAEAILAKIHEVFGVDIVSEHEPAYWGFSTQQEWNEWQDEMAREASTAPRPAFSGGREHDRRGTRSRR